MKLFHKRDLPPADVIAHLPAGERIVSWSDVAGGGVVLASPTGLWWPSDDPAPRLIGWQHISKAIWRDGRLAVTQADVVDELLLVDRAPVYALLDVPRDLPPVVRKRVEANIVRTELVAVGGGTARFVARRVPGEDGLRWWVRLEDGARDSESVRSAIRARLDILQSEQALRS